MKIRIVKWMVMAVLAQASFAASTPAIVPKPVRMEMGAGAAVFKEDARIRVSSEARPEAESLAAILRASTGYPWPVVTRGHAAITLELDPSAGLGPEAYSLVSTTDGVSLRAGTRAGLFFGIQTLRQLLPHEIESRLPVTGVSWSVPVVRIEDAPRFRWRGAMLDVGRYMLTVDEIKRFLDLMALHKLNTLHWHLTEDQGWRIEIKKHPRLTEIGAWRRESPKRGNRNAGDGTRYGGFFTQDQVREVVAYAAARHITVVPEIEMPGHALGALAAYPELGCTGGPYEVATRWGVHSDVFCAGNDGVYTLLEDVLTEVLELFPSTFIHVGGDECPKDRWNACGKCQARIKALGLKDAHELQSHVIRHFDRWLADRGRRLIGWDEILEGGLAPGATVMSWRGVEGGIKAAKSGHDVVMSPTTYLYLDYAQSKDAGEPESIGGLVTLEKVYSYNPVPSDFSPEQAARVLGAQGNLWGEYMFDYPKIEYFAFPRLTALAELTWTPQVDRSYPDFLKRLPNMLKRLDQWNVPYRPLPTPPVATWSSGQVGSDWTEKTWELGQAVNTSGTYEIRFQYRNGEHRLDIAWAALRGGGREIARDTHDGITGSFDKANVYRLQIPPTSRGPFQLIARVRADGGADSNGDILLKRIGD